MLVSKQKKGITILKAWILINDTYASVVSWGRVSVPWVHLLNTCFIQQNTCTCLFSLSLSWFLQICQSRTWSLTRCVWTAVGPAPREERIPSNAKPWRTSDFSRRWGKILGWLNQQRCHEPAWRGRSVPDLEESVFRFVSFSLTWCRVVYWYRHSVFYCIQPDFFLNVLWL